MKKISLYSLTVLSLIALAACSTTSQNAESSSSKTSASSSTTSASKKSTATGYDAVVDELKSLFQGYDVVVEKDVKDEDFPDGHTVISIISSGNTVEGVKQLIEAVDANTATEEDRLILQGFRQTISDVAKKLPDDTTTIVFKYETGAGQYRTIANSGKTKDYISTEK